MVMRAAEHACAREATRLYSQFARESKVLKSKQYVSYYSLPFFFSFFLLFSLPSFRSLTVQQDFACRFIKNSLDIYRKRALPPGYLPASRSRHLYTRYTLGLSLSEAWVFVFLFAIRFLVDWKPSQICCRRDRIPHRIQTSYHPFPYGPNPKILVSCLALHDSFRHSGTLLLTCTSHGSLTQDWKIFADRLSGQALTWGRLVISTSGPPTSRHHNNDPLLLSKTHIKIVL